MHEVEDPEGLSLNALDQEPLLLCLVEDHIIEVSILHEVLFVSHIEEFYLLLTGCLTATLLLFDNIFGLEFLTLFEY